MICGWKMLIILVAGAGSVSAAGLSPVYENNCIACHGADGRARTPQGRKVKASDLRESKMTDTEIERQIREGSKNKSGVVVMPDFGRDLTDAQIKEAVATVRAFRRTPAPAATEADPGKR